LNLIAKIAFRGIIKSIQPRIRLTRSFDQASHTYLGYSIMLDGELGNQQTRFSIGISEAANAKQQLQVNDTISGECLSVLESDKEPVDYYKVSKHLSLGEVHRFFRTLMQLRCHPGAERI